MDLELLRDCVGFEWDEANAAKIWRKHQVSRSDCEQVFFNRPLVVAGDAKHSEEEVRHYALGITDVVRRLCVVFTIRGDLIRVVSARNMSRRERRIFSDAEDETDS